MDLVIHGYYGAGNAGDDAILHAMIEAFHRLRPAPRITVLTRGRYRPYRGPVPIHTVRTQPLRRALRVLRDSKVVIVGGGGLLHDQLGFGLRDHFRGRPRGMAYYAAPVLAAGIYGRPVLLYAVGVGPLRRRTARHYASWVCRNARRITVRDTGSARELAELGIDSAVVTADPAITLSPARPQWARRALLRLGITRDRPVVVLNVRPWIRRRALRRCLAVLVRLGRMLAGRWGVQLLVLTMSRDRGDLLLARRLAHRIGRRYCRVVPYRMTVPRLMALLGQADLVVGMRLHTLVLAAGMGVPGIGIAYDPKVSRFLTDLGLPDLSIPLPEVRYRHLAHLARAVLAAPGPWRRRVREGAARLREREQGNLGALRRLWQELAAAPAGAP